MHVLRCCRWSWFVHALLMLLVRASSANSRVAFLSLCPRWPHRVRSRECTRSPARTSWQRCGRWWLCLLHPRHCVTSLAVPPQRSLGQQRHACINCVVGERAKPFLLMRVEPFQRRRPASRADGSETLAAYAQRLFLLMRAHVDARRVAETTSCHMLF